MAKAWVVNSDYDAYREIARAVVFQALRDAIKPKFVSSEGERRAVKEDALRFLRKAVEEDGYERLLFEVAGICARQALKWVSELQASQGEEPDQKGANDAFLSS
ncbi:MULTISPECIES: hypothetical protein [Ammonifex]|uniref:Uncharacterized protein n=2 Tax=Ammonifex TaxID=42837 RepID=C9RCP9_AMMDK|nr:MULTISPECIES: hypothetical protein [Ammonifex]ACX52026.1 hypothetical protein Adeg_0888 [Ammonifex degensii KC4]RDV83659.1 hypothetical protein DXX99_05020 [Ammonifex thiophilus]